MIRSIDGVCEVTDLRGPGADAPDLLLEVPHGATRSAHYDELRSRLVSDLPADLRDFFFVNTDVGAPELATAIAERYVAAAPTRRAIVVRSLIPRTFVDCNRLIDDTTEPGTSAAGQVTPGLHGYVRDPGDRHLLLGRYRAYIEVARAAYEMVCGGGGHALMVHSYAPRSLDIPVDDRIVERLRAEYHPERIESWPLRAPVDLIADDADGTRLASTGLIDACTAALSAAGHQVALSRTYALHASTMAFAFARSFPDRTLCFEIRRDLLVEQFTPFAEMLACGRRVAALATALAAGLDRLSEPRPRDGSS